MMRRALHELHELVRHNLRLQVAPECGFLSMVVQVSGCEIEPWGIQ